MRRPLARLDRSSLSFAIAAAALLLAFIGVLDHLTGIEFSFSLFYLAPVALVSWRLGKFAGGAGGWERHGTETPIP